jgi:hypothetical protein
MLASLLTSVVSSGASFLLSAQGVNAAEVAQSCFQAHDGVASSKRASVIALGSRPSTRA